MLALPLKLAPWPPARAAAAVLLCDAGDIVYHTDARLDDDIDPRDSR